MPGPGSNNSTKDSNTGTGIVETMTCIVEFMDLLILLAAANMS